MPLKIAALSGSLSQPSRTRLLVGHVAQQAAAALRAEVDVVDLAELVAAAGTLALNALPPAWAEAHQRLARADLLVIGSPVYKGSYAGLFKHFLDLADPALLRGRVAILAATGGSDRHALVIEQHLRPLASFFELHTVPAGIYLRDAEATADGLAQPAVAARIALAVGQARLLVGWQGAALRAAA